MAHPTGVSNEGALRVDFDRRLMLQFCGSGVTSDAGLLPYRELDDVLGLTVVAGNSLADARTKLNSARTLSRPAHEKGALVHPLLDRAEGMFDNLPTTRENVRTLP